MRFDPDKHHRHSLRLLGWDYSSLAWYFVTICVKNKECFLGEITDGYSELTDCGKIVARQWLWLAERYPYIRLDEFVVMPNHLHGLIQLIGNCVGTGRDLSQKKTKTLSEIVGAFKTTSSKAVHLAGFSNFFWQRSFHDRIIRNPRELARTRQYIKNNPTAWPTDRENPLLQPGEF